MKLSVIIVNYNVRYFLEQALLAVRKAARGLDVEVFVVDNASSDDSVPMVREKFPEVRLLVNEENVGFSRANNQAIRRARGEYILLLNPDTVVNEDTFQRCLEFMDAHPEAGALGVRMIDGSGKFLPESKRGFPSPWVAFCKTFGLSTLFPKSRLFNHYHLGYLDEHQTHEVEVLAGAFMLLRKKALDEVGLLDESFFMYGEDIDLSWRIHQAGYKNYYFPHTTIIHYKGESTRKGSLNYVRVFYQAMIIFARKHFKGQRARWFILMLQAAIFFRAALTVVGNVFRRVYLPLLDAALIFGGLFFLKNFWAEYYYKDPDYYQPQFLYFNVPLYIAFWMGGLYFSGAYDEPFNIRRLTRGLVAGTVLLAAVYGFLPLELRPSRAIIVLGAVWTLLALTTLRTLLHFLRFGNFNVGKDRPRNLVIVGSAAESERVRQLLQQAGVSKNLIGVVAPGNSHNPDRFLSDLSCLDEVVHIFRVDEIIFCSRDVPAHAIMQWMTRLGPGLNYRIVPEESLSIIGSPSKNSAGELYTIQIRFNIASPLARRNKRLFDVLLALAVLPLWPLLAFFVSQPLGLLRNAFSVLAGKRTWVGYASPQEDQRTLPPLRQGVLTPLDGLRLQTLNPQTIRRLDFLYAKDYSLSEDLELVWKGFRRLGRSPQTTP